VANKLKTRLNINWKPEPEVVLFAILRAKRKEGKKSYKSAYTCISKTYGYTVCSFFDRIEDEEFKDDLTTKTGSSYIRLFDG